MAKIVKRSVDEFYSSGIETLNMLTRRFGQSPTFDNLLGLLGADSMGTAADLYSVSTDYKAGGRQNVFVSKEMAKMFARVELTGTCPTLCPPFKSFMLRFENGSGLRSVVATIQSAKQRFGMMGYKTNDFVTTRVNGDVYLCGQKVGQACATNPIKRDAEIQEILSAVDRKQMEQHIRPLDEMEDYYYLVYFFEVEGALFTGAVRLEDCADWSNNRMDSRDDPYYKIEDALIRQLISFIVVSTVEGFELSPGHPLPTKYDKPLRGAKNHTLSSRHGLTSEVFVRPHFRNLRADCYYQGEHSQTPRGSRWVFVSGCTKLACSSKTP